MVGYEDGNIRLWDLKQGNATHVIKGEFGQVVACMNRVCDNPLYCQTAGCVSWSLGLSVEYLMKISVECVY